MPYGYGRNYPDWYRGVFGGGEDESSWWAGKEYTDPMYAQIAQQKAQFQQLSYQRALEALQRDEPRFGTISTLTSGQQDILSRLRGMGAPAPTPISITGARVPGAPTQFGRVGVTVPGVPPGEQQFAPVPVGDVGVPGAPTQFAPTGVPGVTGLPQYGRPTYGAMGMAGAPERATTLSRMMGVSPGEEAAAIQAMSQPAMRQFEEQILPMTRGAAVGTGTAWSRSRAREEARAGGALAERLAGMGEQFRMQRRGQAMQAAGLSAQEAIAGTQAGLTRYGTEMQPFMQAQQAMTQAALQRQQLGAQTGMLAQQLGAQAGMQTQRLGTQASLAEMQARTQAGMQAQQLGGQAGMQTQRLGAQMGMAGMQAQLQAALQAQGLGAQAGMQTQRLGAQTSQANMMAQLQAALQGQQLGMQGQMSYQQMLAQLLGIPMQAYYSY